jgi:TetR/AcrR family transcriptional repressor of nem operon
MGRHREFDEAAVVEQAMRAFWSKGFEHTTLDDVIARAKISKSSFYSAFSGKRDLLERALLRYGETWMDGLLEPLSRPGAGRGEIEECFDALVERFSGPLAAQGCLMTNCAVDAAPHDDSVRSETAKLRRAFQVGVLAAIEQGQRDGMITRSEPAQSLAAALVNALNGMSVLAKLQPQRSVLAEIARLSLRLLD